MLMSETAFTLLALTAVWLLVRDLSPLRGWTGFALSGLALACAIHIRPIGYYLAPLGAAGIAAFFVLKDRATATSCVRWRLALTRAGAFLLAPALLVGGWQVNNLRKTGSARFSHLEGLNMYFYRAAGAISMRDHKPLFQVHREMGMETERTDFTGWVAKRPEFAGRNHAVLGEQWLRDGIATIARNPGWYILMHLRSTAALLFDSLPCRSGGNRDGPAGTGTARPSSGCARVVPGHGLVGAPIPLPLLPVGTGLSGSCLRWRCVVPGARDAWQLDARCRGRGCDARVLHCHLRRTRGGVPLPRASSTPARAPFSRWLAALPQEPLRAQSRPAARASRHPLSDVLCFWACEPLRGRAVRRCVLGPRASGKS